MKAAIPFRNLLILTFLLSLIACAKKDDSALLQGKWHLVRVYGYELTETEKETYVEFTADGKFIRKQPNITVEAKWRKEVIEDPKGERLMVYIDREGKDYEDELWIHHVDADSLTVIEMTQKKMILYFARLKE